MKLLLDTHILLWWLADDKQLNKKLRAAISSIDHLVFVSSVSAWEISIKKSLGKLEAPDDFDDILLENTFEPLLLNFEHARLAGKLPKHHNDPFDRMLIAQAMVEDFTLVTVDKHLSQYDVELLN